MQRFGFYIVPRHSTKFIVVDAEHIDEAIRKASKEADHDHLFLKPVGDARRPWLHVTSNLRKMAFRVWRQVRLEFAKYSEAPWSIDAPEG